MILEHFGGPKRLKTELGTLQRPLNAYLAINFKDRFVAHIKRAHQLKHRNF